MTSAAPRPAAEPLAAEVEQSTPASERPLLRFFPRLAQVALALLAAGTLGYALLFVFSRYPYEYLEGVLVDAARRILAGAPLYCDLGTVPCVLLPHPPVYVGLVSGVARLTGLSVGLGRFVSFACLLVALRLLYGIARRQAGRRAALLAPALYLVFGEVGYFSGLMRPEALALALELAAILLVLGPEAPASPAPPPAWLPRVVGGALLLVLALFAKPNLLAGPAAVTFVLLRRDRRQLAAFLASVGAATALVLVLGDRASDGIFIKNHVIAHVSRVYALTQLGRILWYGALPWLPLLLAAVALAVREARRRAFDFPLAFFLAALAWCTFSGSLQGSAAYYYFELYAATGLLFATRVEALAAAAGPFPHVLRGLVWIQLALSLVVNPLIGAERYGSYLRLWKNAPAFLGALASAPGLILVEDPIAAAAADRPLLAEIFMDTQLALKGRWDDKPIIDLLESGGISRVVLREAALDGTSWLQHERLTPRMIEAISRHYALSWSDGSWFVYAYRNP